MNEEYDGKISLDEIRRGKDKLADDVTELITTFQATYNITVDKITIQQLLSDDSRVPVSNIVHVDLAPL